MTAVFPDAEALAIGVLNDGFTADGITLPVSTSVPSPVPAEFITVVLAGGGRQTIITSGAWLIVSAYATTESRAIQLLHLARAYIFATDGVLFGTTEIGGPVNLPDPTVPSHARYRATLAPRSRLSA